MGLGGRNYLSCSSRQVVLSGSESESFVGPAPLLGALGTTSGRGGYVGVTAGGGEGGRESEGAAVSNH